MKKVLIVLLILLLLASGAGLYYFNTVFLPDFLRQTVQQQGRSLIGRDIFYDEIRYRLGQGIVITNLRVSQKHNPEEIFFQAQTVASEIPLTPLLRQRKILLPHITVRGFSAALLKFEDGTWNFSDLLAPRPGSDSNPVEILPGRISLHNGTIRLTDASGGFEPLEVDVTHLAAGLALPQGITLSAAGTIPARKTQFSVKGSYRLLNRSWALSLQAVNLDLNQEIFPLTTVPSPFEHALIRHTDLTVAWQNGVLRCRGDIAAQIRAVLPAFTGSGNIEARGTELIVDASRAALAVSALLIDQAAVHAPDHGSFSGTVRADSFRLTKNTTGPEDQNARFVLSGNMSVDALKLASDKTALDSGRLELSGLSLNIGPEETRAQVAVLSKKLTVSKNRLTASGGVSIPSLAVSLKDGALTVSSPLTLENLEVQEAQRFSAGTDTLTVRAFTLTRSQGQTKIEGAAAGSQVGFTLSGERTGEFLPQDAAFRIDLAEDSSQKPRYALTVAVRQGTVSGLSPQVDTLENISGTVRVNQDRIALEGVGFQTLGTAVTLSGTVTDLANWTAEGSVSAAAVNIPNWLFLLEPWTAPHGLRLTGTADVTATVKGPLARPDQLRVTADTRIRNADVSSSVHPWTLAAVNGQVNYRSDLVEWRGLRFLFDGTPYESSGTLRHFHAPIIDIALKKEGLAASATVEVQQDLYLVPLAALKTGSSEISGSGRVTPGRDGLHVQTQLQGKVLLTDLHDLHPLVRQVFTDWDVQGRGDFTLTYSGHPPDLVNTRFSLTYKSPQTTVRGLQFDALTLKTSQASPHENVFDLAARFYDGQLAVSGDILLREAFPFRARGTAAGIDLGQLKNALPIRDQQINGRLTADITLQGSAVNTTKIQGQGEARIEKGYFVKPNLLRGILTLILASEYQDVVFTDARAQLAVSDNRMRLTDIFIQSSAVDLSGNGWIDLGNAINFTITPNFKIASSIKTDLLKSGTKNLVEKYLSIRVSGSLTQPRYATRIEPGAVMQDAADVIGEGLQNIFRGLGF